MKKLVTLLVFICTGLLCSVTQAAPVGSGFNYQGELTDGGSPANGNYDVLFKAFTVDTGGTEYAVVPTFSPVVVTNGLFSIDNVDFGDALYDGTEYWIEVSVRQTGTDTYFALSPRQRLNATPYAVQADFLAAGGANSGDYLKFDGSNWVGQALNIEPQPWDLENSTGNLSYDEGNVGIGTIPSSALHVRSGNVNPVIIDGGNRTFMMMRENGINRGYLGSFQTQTNTNDEDFEIGTTANSTGNMHIVTGVNNPRITVTADGKVGINNLVPEADLHVAGDTFVGPRGTQGTTNAKLDINSTAVGTTADPLRVRKNGEIKFYVDSNGGASVGSWDTPPANGLKVSGHTLLDGTTSFTGDTLHNGTTTFNDDIKQSSSSKGIAKFMIEARCAGVNSSIIRLYSSTPNNIVTISPTLGNDDGACVLEFPMNLSERFFQTSLEASLSSSPISLVCGRSIFEPTKLFCRNVAISNLVGINSTIMVTIY